MPHHLLNGLADVVQIVRVGDGERIDIVGGADGIIDVRAFAGQELQLQAHGLDRQQQVGENDGRVDIQKFHRLQGDLSSQVGPFADLQDTGLGADIPVLLHVASGLPHEPDRPNIGGPAAAGIQKTTVRRGHSHRFPGVNWRFEHV